MEEIVVLPFFGQGHLLPCLELCRLLCSMQYKTTLILSSNLIQTIPTYLLHHHLFFVAEFSTPTPPGPKRNPEPGPPPIMLYYQQMANFLESYLASIVNPKRPIFAVLDNLMCWSTGIFKRFNLQLVVFFAFSAADISLEYAAWKADVENLKPDESRLLPGLPQEMSFNYSDLTIRRRTDYSPSLPKIIGNDEPVEPEPPSVQPKGKSFPTTPGDEPPWVNDTKGALAFLVNTCDELERPLIHYISSQMGIPVWGVGPLMPEMYWKKEVNTDTTTTTISSETQTRPNRESNYSEEQVVQWLDSKPSRSVIYVSFGSQTPPDLDELEELAKALEELNRPFIWGLQTGPDVVTEYYPHDLESKAGDRGLIIYGWSPQLLILSHSSVGGCLTHSGWNSAMEAIGRGLPTLAWPIRGDQFYNAKSIESLLKVGYIISTRNDDTDGIITKDVIIKSIEKLMNDKEVRKRVQDLRDKAFKYGFPASSLAALNAFKYFISTTINRE